VTLYRPSVELDAFPLPVVVADPDGIVASANAGAAALFGGPITGRTVSSLFPEELDAHPLLLEVAATPGRRVPIHGRRGNGVPFTSNAIANLDSDGRLVFTLRELSGDDLVEASAQLFHAAFDNAPIGMAMFNTDGEYVRVNEALCQMLGRSPSELVGRRDQEFTHPDDREADIDAAWKILKGETDRWQTEKRFVRADGRIVWAIANLSFLRDDRGRPLSWLGQFQDISDRKEAEQRLREMTEHDDLTGVANRRRLTRELATRVLHSARYAERGALLVLDLDGFKEINDTSGHSAGDAVLIDVAQALGRRLRATDVLGRLGGDEFAVILPHVTVADATRVAHDLVNTVSSVCDGAVTASCGVAVYTPETSATPEQLLAEADRAMYEAKRSGRDTFALGRQATAALPR
jgi:diguanylate cyclase (GGDEF)-like protein/PAS domain S-box-containing protein